MSMQLCHCYRLRTWRAANDGETNYTNRKPGLLSPAQNGLVLKFCHPVANLGEKQRSVQREMVLYRECVFMMVVLLFPEQQPPPH